MNSPAQESAFLGRGWSFPPTFSLFTGAAAMVDGDDDIRQSIKLIFQITPGDRQMLPQFGCDLSQFVFGPIDTSIATMIETEIRMALLNYEPRINVDAVNVVPGDAEQADAIIITIDYTVRTNNRRYNYVFPYYLNEATGIPA